MSRYERESRHGQPRTEAQQQFPPRRSGRSNGFIHLLLGHDTDAHHFFINDTWGIKMAFKGGCRGNDGALAVPPHPQLLCRTSIRSFQGELRT